MADTYIFDTEPSPESATSGRRLPEDRCAVVVASDCGASPATQYPGHRMKEDTSERFHNESWQEEGREATGHAPDFGYVVSHKTATATRPGSLYHLHLSQNCQE